MRLLMLAPPGAGKGTQGRRLAKHYGIEHISTGEMLRQEVAEGTPCGRTAKEYLDRGDLVPDELMSKIVLDRVTKASGDGFILDAYPRNLAQAEEAAKLAEENDLTIDGVIYLDVSRDELLRRLVRRGGKESRTDDNEATVRHRLEVFDSQTRPLVEYFKERGVLIPVNGEQPVEQVTQAIIDRLDSASTERASTERASTERASTERAPTERAPAATPSPAPGLSPPDGGSH